MTSSNAWGEFADIFIRTRDAHLEHERAKTELKGLMPDDAQQAFGHGIRDKRSKSAAWVVISTHLPPPVMTDRTAEREATTHILCCSCGTYFVSAASSENVPNQKRL
jgi:hypothetical protein